MGKLINGNVIAEEVLEEVKNGLKLTQKSNPNFTVTLAIVQVGNRSDSAIYIKKKVEKATNVGVEAKHFQLGQQCTESELEELIEQLNTDQEIDGIIVQLPLDSINKIDVDTIIDRIRPEKDVDGLTRMNAGKLARGELEGAIIPCTPLGCLHLIQKATGNEDFVRGKRVVVVGRSKIVGTPAAALFTWHHGTVTICHSQTAQNDDANALSEICRQADILLVAIGQKEMVRGDWIKPGAVVIDCGINVEELGGGKRRLKGDVNFEEAKAVAGYLSPVPGGVGPMTVAMLIRNTFQQALAHKLNVKWIYPPLPTQLKGMAFSGYLVPDFEMLYFIIVKWWKTTKESF